MSPAFTHSQHGAALIVSLLFLLVLTVIGVSTLSNSGMEARMAHNFHLKNTVFHAAETSIDTIIFRADMGTITAPNPAYNVANDVIDKALNTGPQTVTFNNAQLDPSDYLKAADISTANSVTHIRLNEFCPGGGWCNEYELISTANIAATSATARHTQGVSLPAPKLDN